MVTKEKLIEQFTFRRPSAADIALTVLFVILISAVQLIRLIWGMKLLSIILFIIVTVFYIWRMNGRYKTLPMLLFMAALTGVSFMFASLSEHADTTKWRLIFAQCGNILMRINLFDIFCFGFYEIQNEIRNLSEIRKQNGKNKE